MKKILLGSLIVAVMAIGGFALMNPSTLQTFGLDTQSVPAKGDESLTGSLANEVPADEHSYMEDDLTELGVVNVFEGDEVLLTFDALDDLELSGTVVRIKPIGENKQGDITFTAVIRPDNQDPRLRWNMTAVARIKQT